MYSDSITEALKAMDAYAKIIRKERFNRGAVELESSDVKFEYDLEHVKNIEPYKLYDTNRMVNNYIYYRYVNLCLGGRVYVIG